MFAYLSGKLTFADPSRAIIDIGGVGYELRISVYTYTQIKVSLNNSVQLYTHLSIKEDSHTLYGFASEAEKTLFLLLISVSGVGPNTATLALSYMEPSELEKALAREDVRAIQGIKGIGAKTAQRLILELKDKVGKTTAHISLPTSFSSVENTNRTEALTALVTLGLPKAGAEKALDSVEKKFGTGLSVEELVKKALQQG